jgi:hypothetical protein
VAHNTAKWAFCPSIHEFCLGLQEEDGYSFPFLFLLCPVIFLLMKCLFSKNSIMHFFLFLFLFVHEMHASMFRHTFRLVIGLLMHQDKQIYLPLRE